MRVSFLPIAMAAALLSITPLRAGEPSSIKPSDLVGKVFAKVVTAGDIGLTAPIDPAATFDARDDERWRLMGRIMAAFGGPVMERFVKQRQIDATRGDIELFSKRFQKMDEERLGEVEARLANLQSSLAAPDLSDEKKAFLKAQMADAEKELVAGRKIDADAGEIAGVIAREFILAWKVERELQSVYGGRVIFQQFGTEALDARRKLFEEAERNGEITFNDAGVRHMFYYYFNMAHVVVESDLLEKPWWLLDSPK